MTSSAAASTAGGTATLATPGATARGVLRSGGPSTPFTVALPANASCPSDTAHSGYHVYSYLVPKGTQLSAVRFVGLPSTGYGLVDAEGTYYGPVNTAMGTGQIIGIPNDFEWGPLVRSSRGILALSTLLGGANHGVWEAGIACANTHGQLTRYWNTQVTFTAATNATADGRGFTWQAAPGGASAGSASPTATGSPAGAATAAGAAPAPTTAGATGSTGYVATTGGRGRAGASGGTVRSSGGTTPAAVGGSPAASDVPVVAAAAGAAALGLAAGLVLLLRRNTRSGSASAVRGSLR